MWIERCGDFAGSQILERGKQLVYGRTFEDSNGGDSDYFELLQEYSHLENLHWKPEHGSYCRFDDHGDVEHVVSITMRSEDKVCLVSFKRESLEVYLAASSQLLVLLFDFTLFDRPLPPLWGDGPGQLIVESDDLFYRQNVFGPAAYTRGVLIVRPSRSKAAILSSKQDSWLGRDQRQYAEFITHDWRNNRVVTISVAPGATTNYFAANENELPFELSPAFFRPDVLLKYKADRDKYKIRDRNISCRGAWHLRRFDTNAAGQVHAYICDLRKLPYSEQLYWQSFNEKPKAPISRRALEHDFQGRWTSFIDPLSQIRSRVRKWNKDPPSWWRPRDEQTMVRACVPHTSSRDEWAEAFLDLTKLVHEGFVIRPLRKVLAERTVPFDKQEGSIVLLEKILNNVNEHDEPVRLDGLRTAQLVRTKQKGHASGRDAQEFVGSILQEHETLANHFCHICEQIDEELASIEDTLRDL